MTGSVPGLGTLIFKCSLSILKKKKIRFLPENVVTVAATINI